MNWRRLIVWSSRMTLGQSLQHKTTQSYLRGLNIKMMLYYCRCSSILFLASQGFLSYNLCHICVLPIAPVCSNSLTL
jgi:hypothetical protein